MSGGEQHFPAVSRVQRSPASTEKGLLTFVLSIPNGKATASSRTVGPVHF